MIPTAFTSAFFYFTGQQRVVAAAIIGGLSSLAPTLGPTIGGWITDNYSWHWLFFINLAPGAFIAVAVPMLVRIDKPDLTRAELEQLSQDYSRDFDLGVEAHPCDLKSSIDPSGRVRSSYKPPPIYVA